MSEQIILFDSNDAARFETGISGWVDRKGHFFGKDENAARYSGCTHRKCKQCGRLTVKHRVFCDPCGTEKDIERYEKLEKVDWDGKTMLYSDSCDVYFSDLDEIQDYIEEHECALEALFLIKCEPSYLRQIDEYYFSDQLPEDGDLPDEISEALEALNKLIREHGPVSWYPGKKAINTKSICFE